MADGVETGPEDHEANVGPDTVSVEELQEPKISEQLPPCPDWPDLN